MRKKITVRYDTKELSAGESAGKPFTWELEQFKRDLNQKSWAQPQLSYSCLSTNTCKANSPPSHAAPLIFFADLNTSKKKVFEVFACTHKERSYGASVQLWNHRLASFFLCKTFKSPSETPSTVLQHTTKVATYTFSVDGNFPLSSYPCINSIFIHYKYSIYYK